MMKAVIKTDAGDFVANGLQYENTAAGRLEAWKAVKDVLASGMPFEGDDGVFSIEPGAAIKAIVIRPEPADDVKEEASDDVKEEATTWEPQGVYPFARGCDFLGHRLTVKMLGYKDGDRDYVVLASLNDLDPFEVLSSSNQAALLTKLGTAEGWKNTQALVPPSSLGDYEEYEAYLVDYVRELAESQEYVAKNKNARAWQDWKGVK